MWRSGEGRKGSEAKESTFSAASERKGAEAPGEALVDCRVGRGVTEKARRNRAGLERLGSRARGGYRPVRYSGWMYPVLLM